MRWQKRHVVTIGRNSLVCFPHSDRFTDWRILWITRPDLHHPVTSKLYPVPLSTYTFFFNFFLPERKARKQGSSIAVSRPVIFLQGTRGSHTFSHMAKWVWIFMGWIVLGFCENRRSKMLTVCGKDRAGERCFDPAIFLLWHEKRVQAQSYGLSS